MEVVEASLRHFYSCGSSVPIRFVGYKVTELEEELAGRISEEDDHCSLGVLSAVEAILRNDYSKRVKNRLKDRVSMAFREIFKEKEYRIRLEDELLDVWEVAGGVNKQKLRELKGAYKLRHWLAHGKYWEPKLGRNYDFATIYQIADSVMRELKARGVEG
jgi:hypothetical protein